MPFGASVGSQLRRMPRCEVLRGHRPGRRGVPHQPRSKREGVRQTIGADRGHTRRRVRDDALCLGEISGCRVGQQLAGIRALERKADRLVFPLRVCRGREIGAPLELQRAPHHRLAARVLVCGQPRDVRYVEVARVEQVVALRRARRCRGSARRAACSDRERGEYENALPSGDTTSLRPDASSQHAANVHRTLLYSRSRRERDRVEISHEAKAFCKGLHENSFQRMRPVSREILVPEAHHFMARCVRLRAVHGSHESSHARNVGARRGALHTAERGMARSTRWRLMRPDGSPWSDAPARRFDRLWNGRCARRLSAARCVLAFDCRRSRALAQQLGISRRVVSDAYNQLQAQGFLLSREREAPVVAEVHRATEFEPSRPAAPQLRYDLSATRPDVSLFPLTRWLAATQRVARGGPAILDYRDARGERALRDVLADHLGRTRGVIADPAEIVIVQGTAQGVDLLMRMLQARRASRVAVEDPSQTTARERIAANGLESCLSQSTSRGWSSAA